MKRIVSGILAAVTIAGGIAVWGLYGPITKFTPFGLILNRPEIRNVSKNILLGNNNLIFSSPFLAHMTQKAWIAEDMVYGFNALTDQAKAGKTIYYNIYTEEEKKEDPRKEQVCLYCLHGNEHEKKPFVLLFAGGGFSSVCTFCESLPVAAAFQEMGYTVFAGTYRLSGEFGKFQDSEILAEDIAREIQFIEEHADELNVLKDDYLIGGFSAGSCTAAVWCDLRYGYQAYHMKPPAAYLCIYGIAEDSVDHTEVPAFIRFCKNDQYFPSDLPDLYTSALEEKGIAYDMKIVDCLHGFGLGSGTDAEGWIVEAENFWKECRVTNL